MKRWRVLFYALLFLVIIGKTDIVLASTNGITQEQAVQWAKDRADENSEINDGSGWTQCVEFIWKYYELFLDYNVEGNACDYLTDKYGACPYSEGWSRPEKSTVQPGDIAIWDANTYFREDKSDWCNAVGHIGIVISVNGNSMVTAETNAGGERGACIYKDNREVSCISGLIRPNFKCAVHTWDAGVITKEGTCKTIGTKKYTCIKCGETKEEQYSTEHTYRVISKKKATLKKAGKIIKVCSVCKERKTEKIPRIKTIKLESKKFTYTGKAIKPEIIVKNSHGVRIKPTFYKVKYGNNKKVGDAKVVVRFKDKYSGLKKLTFKIYPGGTSITKLMAESKSISLKWVKQKGITGYQIQYGDDKKFKNAKTIKIGERNTNSKKIKDLKSNKKYYVRIRTYNGSMFSGWSNIKSIVTKASRSGKKYNVKELYVDDLGKTFGTIKKRYGWRVEDGTHMRMSRFNFNVPGSNKIYVFEGNYDMDWEKMHIDDTSRCISVSSKMNQLVTGLPSKTSVSNLVKNIYSKKKVSWKMGGQLGNQLILELYSKKGKKYWLYIEMNNEYDRTVRKGTNAYIFLATE